MRNNWRASLVPAAAVIPAPIVYIKVAAVKKLVVGFRLIKIKVYLFRCVLYFYFLPFEYTPYFKKLF